MATGTPKRSRGGNIRDAVVSYPGKAEPDQILAVRGKPLMCLQGDASRIADASICFGENLEVLRSLRDRQDVRGHVQLVYIDPPYATETSFQTRGLEHAYDDVLTGPGYLEFLRERIVLMHDLLKDGGAFYVHLDDKTVFHAKVLVDEIFGSSSFRNMITRKKCNPKNYTKRQYGNVSDYILYYVKGAGEVWNRPFEAWTTDRAREYSYIELETGRRYMKVPVHAPGIRNGETGLEWRGKRPPPGKHWQYTPTRLDEMDARGEIVWSANGNPRRKVYLDDSAGVPVQDIWLDFRDAHNQNVRISGYPTEKPEALLHRIMTASTNEGDLVLDAFAGSGTTLAVAASLNRKWIGIDNSTQALTTMINRFERGLTAMGDFVTPTSTSPQTVMPIAAEQKSKSANFSIWTQQNDLLEAVKCLDAKGQASSSGNEPQRAVA